MEAISRGNGEPDNAKRWLGGFFYNDAILRTDVAYEHVTRYWSGTSDTKSVSIQELISGASAKGMPCDLLISWPTVRAAAANPLKHQSLKQTDDPRNNTGPTDGRHWKPCGWPDQTLIFGRDGDRLFAEVEEMILDIHAVVLAIPFLFMRFGMIERWPALVSLPFASAVAKVRVVSTFILPARHVFCCLIVTNDGFQHAVLLLRIGGSR